MARFHLTVKDFQPPLPKLEYRPNEAIYVSDFLRCVFELGVRGPGSLRHRPEEYNRSVRHDAYSCKERLVWPRNGDLAYFDYWMSMDGSVKNVSAYWIGMAFTKLVAERILKVPWLAYVDPLIPKVITVKPKNTKLRPDLVGHTRNGEWHAMESKAITVPPGKQRAFSYTKAERQLDAVHKINGKRPTTLSTCLTKLRNDKVRVTLRDPRPISGPRGCDINIDEDGFLKEYYDPLIALVLSSPVSEYELFGRPFKMAPFLHQDETLLFGIDAAVVEKPERAPALTSWIEELSGVELSSEFHSLGPDGTIVLDLVEGWDALNRTLPLRKS